MINKIKGTLFGLAVGDALGVPVEFKSREYLKAFPIKGMIGHGSWNQLPGTWSDDSSLAFCLAESLSGGYNINDIAQNFIKWKESGYWGAHNKVFDIGGTTRYAIDRLIKGTSPLVSGGMAEQENGNGSLMRIIPLIFFIKKLPIEERFVKVKEVSSITHAHFRSIFACFIFLEMAISILDGKDSYVAFMEMRERIKGFLSSKEFDKSEIALFDKVLNSDIKFTKEASIRSSGYVLDTLEASIWCLINTDNYADAVLRAVNLGGDTDTTGCVTGGIAGLLYGHDEIPQVWVNEIARKDDIQHLAEKLFGQTV